MSIFSTTKERKEVIINGNKYNYEKHIYSFDNSIYYKVKCPKYLHLTLMSRYSKYGVEVWDKEHLSIKDECIIPTLIAEIVKGKEIISQYHQGQKIYRLDYDANYNLSIVFIYSPYFTNIIPTYMVNHTTKKVSPIHGYMGHGREFAKKLKYEFQDLVK